MSKYKWHKTGIKGVRYRVHPNRKNGIRFDRYYTIRYQTNGERIEEGLGWESEGWTMEQAVVELYELKTAAKTGSGPTRMSAKRELAAKEMEEKELNKRLGIKFGTFVKKKYLPLQEGNKSQRSIAREKSLFKKWINPVIADTALKRVSQIQLERIKSNMAKGKTPILSEKEAKKPHKKMSPRSIHYALSVVRQVFNTATRLGYFDGSNPVKTIKKPKYDNKRTRFLSYDESEALLAEIKKRSRQTHDITILSLHCGLRAGECFDLKWGQLDFNQGIINVMDTKSGRNRHVYMTDAIKEIFQANSPGKPTDLVFPSRTGGRINEISNAFQRSVNKLNFNHGIKDRREKVTFHTMRHTFASWSVMAGVSLYELQRLLGHQDFSMVQRYSHLSPEYLQGAKEKFQIAIETAQQQANAEKQEEHPAPLPFTAC